MEWTRRDEDIFGCALRHRLSGDLLVRWEAFCEKVGLALVSARQPWADIRRKLKATEPEWLSEEGLRLRPNQIKQLVALYQTADRDSIVIDHTQVASELGLRNAEEAQRLYESIGSKLQTTQAYDFGPKPQASPVADMERGESPRKKQKAVPSIERQRESLRSARRPGLGPPVSSARGKRKQQWDAQHPELLGDDINFILFVLTSNQNRIKLNWKELGQQVDRSHKSIQGRFSRLLDQLGWQFDAKEGAFVKIKERRLNKDGTLRISSKESGTETLGGRSGGALAAAHASNARLRHALSSSHLNAGQQLKATTYQPSVDRTSDGSLSPVIKKESPSRQHEALPDENLDGEDSMMDSLSADESEDLRDAGRNGMQRTQLSNSSIKLKLEDDLDLWDFD